MIKKHHHRNRAGALAALAWLVGCGQSYDLSLRRQADPEQLDASTTDASTPNPQQRDASTPDANTPKPPQLDASAMMAPDARTPAPSCDAAEECCDADDDCPLNAHICDRSRGACVQCFSSSDCQESGDAQRCVNYRCVR